MTFEEMDCDLFFISYREGGLTRHNHNDPTISRDFGRVEHHDILHQRFKSNAAGGGGKVMEYLYVIDLR